MIEFNGWKLVTEEDQDSDGFTRYEHFAFKGEARQHLHGSSFIRKFDPDQEQFEYLVRHGFPRSPIGNWTSRELKRLIKKEKADAAVHS